MVRTIEKTMQPRERVPIPVTDSVVHSRADTMSGMPVFHSKEGFVSGTPIFVGTRVPIKSLFDYLAEGHDLDEFLYDFPGVSREQAVRTLDMANEVLESIAYEAVA